MKGRKWSLGIGVSLAALAGLTSLASAQTQAKAKQPVAALVNGEAITLGEVDALLQHQPPTTTSPTEIQRRQMQLEALSMLIDDRVVQQFLRKNGPPVSPAEVAKRLGELEAGLKAQGRTLNDFLRENSQTLDQLQAEIVKMLQWAGYVRRNISEAELKRYYEENKEYFDQIKVRASHIVMRVAANASPNEVQAARTKLLNLRQEIVSGKIDFTEAAKKYSQCPSALEGGNIGYFSRKYTVQEPIAKAAFALKVGDVSDIVQSDYGLHLIKVTDRKAEGKPSNFEQVKDDVRDTCAMELMNNLVAQQRRLAKIEVKLADEPIGQTVRPAAHKP
jgi:parvulin-like peptidyl-prolyl isomerase